jgi:steroid delta-isomerase-like uncharacterized protein
MTDADAATLVHRWFEELFNGADVAVADEILAADVRYHGPESLSPADVRTPEEIKEYVRIYREAFPDLRYEVDEVFGSGEQVCARWTATGTHRSDLFGVEATGQVFTGEGINVFVVEDGRLAEVWSSWDTLGMARELDVVTSTGFEFG